MSNRMDDESLKIKSEHEIQRNFIEEKIRSTPSRKIPKSGSLFSYRIVIDSNSWNKFFAKLCVFALLFSIAYSVIISISLAYAITRPPQILSYLMDDEGRVVKLEPIQNPSLTNTEVTSWAADRILDIHSLTFADYSDHIQALSENFTKTAFKEYQLALNSSKSLEKIVSQKLVMWAVPKEAPKIISSKVVGGKYIWVIEMKIEQFIGGGNFTPSGNLMKSVITIERTSQTRNLSGVLISKYLSREIGLE